MRLVLASASPARLAVLRAAGIEPTVRVSTVDEDAVAAGLADPSPAQLVGALAQAKADDVAKAVADEYPDCVLIGCDSMLAIDGEVLGKPRTVDVALARWRAMAGRAGELLTGHAVCKLEHGSVVAQAQDVRTTTVHFGQPSERELAAYVESGEPLLVAGGFTIDGLGGWFIDRIDGDPSCVVGLSLPLTRRLLRDVGCGVVDLWH
ncbi:MAG: septum formation inhibitor Maf [Sciscionella sp.]|nr:septum formation inhibitor Maf [Sciscionella sp.]